MLKLHATLDFPWKWLNETEPDERCASDRKADSLRLLLADALLPNSKLIDLPEVLPPIEILPDDANVITHLLSVLQPLL